MVITLIRDSLNFAKNLFRNLKKKLNINLEIFLFLLTTKNMKKATRLK